MKHTTLLLLLKDTQVLLAMKKRGFGEGKWNGVGGKIEEGESIEEAAIRECYEEIGVTPQRIEKVAQLSFLFAGDTPDTLTHTFVARQWVGEPTESEEMAPQWFHHEEIPYHRMWPDDQHWLPHLLQGKKVVAQFAFDAQQNMLPDNFSVEVVEELPDEG